MFLNRLRDQYLGLSAFNGVGAAARGFAAIFSNLFFEFPFVVSVGGSVSRILEVRFAFLLPVFVLYERLLYCLCAGFVEWAPYLVGQAVTFATTRYQDISQLGMLECLRLSWKQMSDQYFNFYTNLNQLKLDWHSRRKP